MRLPAPIALTATTWCPAERQTVEEAVAAGDVDARSAAQLGYDALPVAPATAPPDMAVLASEQVLRRAGCRPEQVGVLLHASIHHQGHEAWSAPHYIANRIGADRATPVGLLQQCNGGAAGVELAVTRLLADPGAGPALVTTADRFLEPSWHRWLSDYGMATGDGATAVLVHRRPDLRTDLLLHSIATTVASDLEVMHRGDDELTGSPMGHGPRIDVRRTKRAFLRDHGNERFVKTSYRGIREAVERCLAEAGLAGDDPAIRWAVLPRLGLRALREVYAPPLADAVAAPLLEPGRDTGHLGAGDFTASLADLCDPDLLPAGRYAVVLNGGGGFTWTCAVVSSPGHADDPAPAPVPTDHGEIR